MATIREMIRQANADGCMDENAEAKVCQDVVLKALSDSFIYSFHHFKHQLLFFSDLHSNNPF